MRKRTTGQGAGPGGGHAVDVGVADRFRPGVSLQASGKSVSRELLVLGYYSKLIREPTEIRNSNMLALEEIRCVTECGGYEAPDGWIDHWKHNTDTWLFDTPEAAWSVVPASQQERYRLYGYRLLPTLFHESGVETEHPLPKLTAVPLPDGFSRLGYDAVVRDVGKTEGDLNFPSGFGCSPLCCNGMAEECPVNRYCLVDDLDAAIAMARDFAVGNCEPGPYCVVEVWRRKP